MHFQFDRSSDAPLYMQLANAIREMIATGELRPGDKLPTVRALFNETGLSDGTIRHAYESLAREGILDMSQGRGTFVLEPSEVYVNREARAMDAIDDMIERLTALSFTPREIRLFLDIKIAQLQGGAALMPVAVIDCNPECLSEAAQQLSGISGISLSEYLLDDVRRAPVELTRDMRLVITTQTHVHEVGTLLKDTSRIMRMALSPSAQTLAALSRIESAENTIIFCRSARFSQIVKSGMRLFPHLRFGEPITRLPGANEPIGLALADKKAIVVPPDYLSHVSEDDRAALIEFADGGGLIIPYHHQIDQGSLLYIEEKIRSVKSQSPESALP